MNVVTKKNNFVFLVLTAILVFPIKGNAQDLFDDSFLSDPENKSISITNTEAKSVPVVADKTNAPVITAKEIIVEAPANTAKEDIIITEQKETVEPASSENASPKVAEKATMQEPKAEIKVEAKVEALTQKTASTETPSEKVIGSLSKEMFHDMANLEKENSLLNLQLKQEKLKSEINSVKASQRQAVIDEIEKREMAARARIEWEYQQELKEIELWEKRQKAELIAKQIEGIINGTIVDPSVQNTPIAQTANANVNAPGNTPATPEEPELVNASEIYYIVEIRGLDGKLTAKVADEEEKKVFFVKDGTILPSGHKVVEINKDYVKVVIEDEEQIIGFAVTQSDN